MSDRSDNACEFEEISLESLQQQVPAKTPNSEHVTAQMAILMKQFAELCLKYTDSDNSSVRQLATHEQNLAVHTMEEKMRLLCGMNTPMGSKLCTMAQVENMYKQLLQQFHKLYNAEDECVRAYAAHCDEAIKAKMALADNADFDEFTDMPHTKLMECIDDMKIRHNCLLAACADKTIQLKSNDKEYSLKYKSMLKETAMLEEYELEAIEAFEQKKFELEKRPRVLKQQIQLY